ncbi:Polyketide synthase enoylreductase [Penicillium expansum]|nr:Polyketide synthase enoylreductase [Penicillium expansum]
MPSDWDCSHQPPSNQAAWFLRSSRGSDPLEVGVAPFTPPSAHQIVVKNCAVAINAVDWTKQLMGRLIFSWIKYPFVLGNDCAGEIVQVGDMVSHIKVGDRVLAHALSMDKAVNNPSEGAFQRYTVIRDNMATRLASFPRSINCRNCLVRTRLSLALNRPGIPLAIGPDWCPEVVLIWGGSTSVGCNAIQLAAAAGYEVITTCSPRNFAYVTNLGASAVFDYNDKLTIQEIVELMDNKKVVGAIAIGNNSIEPCIEVLSRTDGSKFVVRTAFPFLARSPIFFNIFHEIATSVWENFKIWKKAKRCGVKTKFVSGTSAAHTEIGAMIYNEFLTEALATGAFVAAPKPNVIGRGLDRIQLAMYTHKRGVSAQKVVVSL